MIYLNSQLVQIPATFKLVCWHLSCMFSNLLFCQFKYLCSYLSWYHNCHSNFSSSTITQCHKYDKWRYYLCFRCCKCYLPYKLLSGQSTQFVNSKIEQLGQVCEPPNIVQKFGNVIFSWLTIFDIFSIWPCIHFIVCNISCK